MPSTSIEVKTWIFFLPVVCFKKWQLVVGSTWMLGSSLTHFCNIPYSILVADAPSIQIQLNNALVCIIIVSCFSSLVTMTVSNYGGLLNVNSGYSSIYAELVVRDFSKCSWVVAILLWLRHSLNSSSFCKMSLYSDYSDSLSDSCV